MQVRTELSERPPVYSVTNDAGTARIRFYEDIAEEQRGDDTVFTATMWEMSCPWQENLSQRVKRNPDQWRAKVAAVTAAEESAARLEDLKVTATDDAICDLAEIVADLMDAVTTLAEMIA